MKLLGTIAIPAGVSRNNYSTGAAIKDFGAVGSGAFDSVLRATAGGVDGDNITVSLTGDSAAGVTIDVSGNAIAIHFKTLVSTVADVEEAIAALTTDTEVGLIAVDVPGTGATVLDAGTDEFGATHLASGAAGAFELPQRLSGIYLEASGNGITYASDPDARNPSPLTADSSDFKLYAGSVFGESIAKFSGAPVAVAGYNTTGGALTLKVFAVAGSN